MRRRHAPPLRGPMKQLPCPETPATASVPSRPPLPGFIPSRARPLLVCTLLLGVLVPSATPTRTAAQADAGDSGSRYALIPWPSEVVGMDGQFEVQPDTEVRVSPFDSAAVLAAAAVWADRMRVVSGFSLPVRPGAAQGSDLDPSNDGGHLTFRLIDDASLSAEGYRIEIAEGGAVVEASTSAGLFYAAQTLRQLSPVAIERGGRLAEPPPGGWTLPAVRITDRPRFSYRGLHLDVARHFFGVDHIKRTLDRMAQFKLNRFHWHLTEDQGWRIQIDAYPRLTEVGAWRDGTLIGHYSNRPHRFDGRRYGGYYTADDVREVVEYATKRHITVVPEIEMPGHSSAAIAAYPELGCGEGPVEVAQLWGVFEDIYCPSEATFEFLTTVLDEVMALFPGPWIHIGGDEAPKAQWERSALAQSVIAREGLADEHELQSWFIRRIERHVNGAGRRLVGWDEIVEGGLSPTATLMFWRDWNQEALSLAAQQGNDVIMTPNSVMYFDHYQGDPAGEPVAIGGLTTLEDVYAYEPVPEVFGPESRDRILGAQANLWTEYIDSPQKAEYMAFPRALALSEVVWSRAGDRDFEAFTVRMGPILQRLDLLGVRYRRPR